MCFSKENIEKNINFLFNNLKLEIAIKKEMSSPATYSDLSEINKMNFLLTMLEELKIISKERYDFRPAVAKSGLIFSCISEETLRKISFKLFILDKFNGEDLDELDWKHARESVNEDIRKNLPNKIYDMSHEHALESRKKDLAELQDQSKKLEEEYKKYWLKSSEMEANIASLKKNMQEINLDISDLEKKILRNKQIISAINIIHKEKKEILDSNNNSIPLIQGNTLYSFDLIKYFFQLTYLGLINQYEHASIYHGEKQGSYAKIYESIISDLHNKMLKKMEKVVGYRLAKDISDDDKDCPHISRALMDVFIDSLDFEIINDQKVYYIKYGSNYEKIFLDLGFIENSVVFKSDFARGFYNAVVNSDFFELCKDKAKDVSLLSENDKDFDLTIFLGSLASDIKLDFLNKSRISSSGKNLSNVNDIFSNEFDLLIYISGKLRNFGYIVSEEYLASFIFKKRIKNLVNTRLQQVDKDISAYLDSGVALPFVTSIFPEQDITTEEVAKTYLNDLLRDPGEDKLRVIISHAIRNHILIKSKEKIDAISESDLHFFGHAKENWIEKTVNYMLFDEKITLPKLTLTGEMIEINKELTSAFIEKLKSIYKDDIQKKRLNVVKSVSEELRKLPSNTIFSVAQWHEEIKKKIKAVCPLGKYFVKQFSDVVFKDICDQEIPVFIDKFNINTIFFPPTYPIDINLITETSREAVDKLLQSLGVYKNSADYQQYYNACMLSYNRRLCDWEFEEIKNHLRSASEGLDQFANNLIAKGLFESGIDFLLKSLKNTLKAGVAIGGAGLLMGLTPQMLLCLNIMQVMTTMSPVMGVVLIGLFYRYILPKFLSEKSRNELEGYEAMVLTAFNMAILPIVELIKQIQLLSHLKFPNNRDTALKMLVSFMSALVGGIVFIYCPMIIPVVLIETSSIIAPLLISYVAAAFTFFMGSISLNIRYNKPLEERLALLLSNTLSSQDVDRMKGSFLDIFEELEKDNDFLKKFKVFLSQIDKKSRDIQVKAIVYFIEARTLELLSSFPFSMKKEAIDRVNQVLQGLKDFSVKTGVVLDNTEQNLFIKACISKAETLLSDVPRRCVI